MARLRSILPLGIAALALAGFAALLTAFSGANARQPATVVYAPGPELAGMALATFAGGCFWCVESAFEKVPGVKEAVSGYTGGRVAGPAYREVAGGSTGHVEAVQVYYDPAVINYEGLLEAFWRMHNPTDSGGQFVDRGAQYRPVIFYHDDLQRTMAEQAKDALDKSGRYDKPVTIEILPAETFYAAEDYHQDYYKKNPVRYQIYRYRCGRDARIKEVWGDEAHRGISEH